MQNSDVCSIIEDKDDLRVLGLVLTHNDFIFVPVSQFNPDVTGQRSYPP